MKRFIQGWLCAGLLCTAGTVLAQSTDVIDRARLATLASKDTTRLFDDPQVGCYLGGLLSKEELKSLKESMQLVGAEESPDKSGGLVVTGGVRGLYTIMEGIVVVQPDGRVWAAYIDDEQVKYFTNDKGSLQRPPASIDTWRENFKDKPIVPVSAERKVRPEELAARCGRERLSAELERFNRSLSGTVCEAGAVSFSEFQAGVVKGGASGGRVYFFSQPVPCPETAACPSRMKAYLIENDVVALATGVPSQEGFVCAAYQGSKGKRTVGWLPGNALSQSPLSLPAGAGKLGRKPADWAGTWKQSSASIDIQVAGPNRIHARGEASSGANTGEFELAYTVSGPIAQKAATRQEEDACEVRLRLFNNALYAEDNGHCGGMGVGFQGLFYRAAR